MSRLRRRPRRSCSGWTPPRPTADARGPGVGGRAGHPAAGRHGRARFPPQPLAAAIRDTPTSTHGWPRARATPGRSGCCGSASWPIWCCALGRLPPTGDRAPHRARRLARCARRPRRRRAEPPGRPAGQRCRADRGVDGEPITAAQLRELLEQLDASAPAASRHRRAARCTWPSPTRSAGRCARWSPAPNSRRVRRGCPDHPGTGCGCPVLDLPAPVDRYRPSAAQGRFLRARDRTCRHPGCRNSAGRADLDHVVPHADGGATSCQNLCCLCRRHHRLKTHAPGWRFTMTADGTLTVPTPSGVRRTTRPPGHRGPPPRRPAALLSRAAVVVRAPARVSGCGGAAP